MILLEGGMNKDGFVPVNFFAYAAFRKRFMKILLDLLDEEINTPEFKQLKRDLYRKLKDGFYVFSPPSKFKTVDGLIKYVTRYVSRPVMAESRILDYDKNNVTFWYQRHEDNKIVIEKIIQDQDVQEADLEAENTIKQAEEKGITGSITKDIDGTTILDLDEDIENSNE